MKDEHKKAGLAIAAAALLYFFFNKKDDSIQGGSQDSLSDCRRCDNGR